MINESEGPNFDKLYRMFTRMTEEEFVMLESVILSSNSVFNESGDVKIPNSNFINVKYNSMTMKQLGLREDSYPEDVANNANKIFEAGFKAGFNYYKSKC